MFPGFEFRMPLWFYCVPVSSKSLLTRLAQIDWYRRTTCLPTTPSRRAGNQEFFWMATSIECPVTSTTCRTSACLIRGCVRTWRRFPLLYNTVRNPATHKVHAPYGAFRLAIAAEPVDITKRRRKWTVTSLSCRRCKPFLEAYFDPSDQVTHVTQPHEQLHRRCRAQYASVCF